jgi:hypothetical protein
MPRIPCDPGYYADVQDSLPYAGRAFISVSTHATPAEVRALIAALEPYAAPAAPAPVLHFTEWLTGSNPVRYAIEYRGDSGDWRPTKRPGLTHRTWATEAEAAVALHRVLNRPSHRITNYRVVGVDA